MNEDERSTFSFEIRHGDKSEIVEFSGWKREDGLFQLDTPSIRKYVEKMNPFAVEGSIMHLDENIALDIVWYQYQKTAREILKREIKEGDIVAEGGSHIGFLTLLMSRLVGKTGTVYAFEPDPLNFKALKENISINNYTNIKPFMLALAEKNEKGKLYFDRGTLYFKLYEKGATAYIDTEIVRLDSIVKKADFVFLDVAGSEPRAIEGMGDLLKTTPKILTYYPIHRFIAAGIDPLLGVKLLKDNGYQIYNVDYVTQLLEKNLQERGTGKETLIENIEDLVKDDKNKLLFCKK